MNRWLFILIPIALATCQRPTEFEATNQSDPESPNLILESPESFEVTVGPTNHYTLKWRSGRFDGARVQVDMVRDNVHQRVFDAIPPMNSISLTGPPAQSTPFRFAIRYVIGDTVSNWRSSISFRYELAPITSSTVLGQPTGIRFSWTHASESTYRVYSFWNNEMVIRVPTSEWTVFKSVENGPFEPIAITTTKTYFDEFTPELGVRYRYKVRTRTDSLSVESAVSTVLR